MTYVKVGDLKNRLIEIENSGEKEIANAYFYFDEYQYLLFKYKLYLKMGLSDSDDVPESEFKLIIPTFEVNS
jgi:hypothetical protein